MLEGSGRLVPPAPTAAELLALGDRALTVLARLPSTLDAHRDGVSKEMVKAALTAFAQEDLLNLAFLDPKASTVHPHDMRRTATIMEVLGGGSGSLASIYMVNAILGGAVVAIEGTSEQKERLLPQLRMGKLELAFAMTEPQAGSDAASLSTTASPDGEGFVLSGEKLYTTGAATADWIIVVARVAAAPKRTFGLFLVPHGAAGLTVEPLAKLSANIHASCRLKLDEVRVPPSQILGGAERIGSAWSTLRVTGSLERLMVAAMALGLASAVVTRAVEFAKSRQQFGQPIAAFQSIQHMLVEMQVQETSMRLFVEQALSALESGRDATQEVCMAKYVCSEQLQTIVSQGMRVMGGRSYFDFEDMARYYSEAPFSLFAGGTVEIQKMLIARTMGLG